MRKTKIKTKSEKFVVNKIFSKLNRYFTSMLKFSIATALFLIAAILISGAGIIVEDGSFNVSNDLLVNTDTLYVDSISNNVGIGTSSPASKLDIDTGSNTAGLRLRGTSESVEIADLYVSGSGALLIDTTGGTGTQAYIDLRSEDEQYGLILRESDGTGVSLYANLYLVDLADDTLYIGINYPYGGAGNPFAITAAGKVWVANLAASGGDPMCWDGSAGSYIGDCTSLTKHKRDINNLTINQNLWNKFMQLQPVTYFWKNQEWEQNMQLGFLAEDVEKIHPVFADYIDEENGSTTLSGINWDAISTANVLAIQDLKKENEMLKRELCQRDNSFSWC